MTDLQTVTPSPVPATHTGATAAAQHAVAQIQARAMVAIARPRDIMHFREAILRDCERPGFADQARYEVKNRGSGMSIRFAESALRHFGNLYCEAVAVDDNAEQVTVRVSVTDLETNACDSRDVTIQKTVERRKKPKDESIIVGTRVNSYGDPLYILRATDEEILGKRNAAVNKAKRVLIIAFLPFDIVEECEARCMATSQNRDAQDPDAAVRKLCDAFAGLKVTPQEIADYMGKAVGRLSPKDLSELRGIYEALRGGDVSWEEVVEAKHPPQTTGDVTNEMDKGRDPNQLGDSGSSPDPLGAAFGLEAENAADRKAKKGKGKKKKEPKRKVIEGPEPPEPDGDALWHNPDTGRHYEFYDGTWIPFEGEV
jgi:hypothetical protein